MSNIEKHILMDHSVPMLTACQSSLSA